MKRRRRSVFWGKWVREMIGCKERSTSGWERVARRARRSRCSWPLKLGQLGQLGARLSTCHRPVVASICLHLCPCATPIRGAAGACAPRVAPPPPPPLPSSPPPSCPAANRRSPPTMPCLRAKAHRSTQLAPESRNPGIQEFKAFTPHPLMGRSLTFSHVSRYTASCPT